MRTWSYAINSLYKTAEIIIEEKPFVIQIMESTADFICSHTPAVPLPPLPIRLWDKNSIEFNEGKKWTKMNEWYGDFGGLMCGYSHNVISRFCWRYTKTHFIKVDYDKLREATYEKDKKFWEYHDEIDASEEPDVES